MSDAMTRDRRELVRSPTYVLGLIIGVTVLVLGVVVPWQFPDSVGGFTEDVSDITSGFAQWVRAIPAIVFAVAVLVLPLVVNLLLIWQRNWRMFVRVNLIAVVAIASNVLVQIPLTGFKPPDGFPDLYTDAGQVFPSSGLVVAPIAILMIGIPYLTIAQRRLAWGLVLLSPFAHIISLHEPPVGWLVEVGLGVTVGCGMALLLKTPDTQPDEREIITALGRSGVRAGDLRKASVDARGSTPWFGQRDDGHGLFIKVLGRDNRAADLMFRLDRFIRFRRTIGDERPFSSLRRLVEHEAVLSMRARSVGARTPELVAVSEVGNDGMVLAFDELDGKSVDSVDPDALTDDVLDAIWEQVEILRQAGIAHRDLRLANLFLDSGGQPWLIDFGFSELAASDRLLATDVAELLSSSASVVGVRRAVDSAERVLGTDVLGASLYRLQPLALGSATKSALSKQKLLKPLQEEVRTRAGIDEPHYEELRRVSPTTAFTIVVAAAAMWFIIPQLADAQGAITQIKDANWWFALAAVFASVFTYLGAGVSMVGSVSDPLPIARTTLAQVASSFTNRITPAKLGGLALNMRYLQKSGLESPVAVTAIGINTVGGLLVHVATMVLMALVLNDSNDVAFSLPSGTIILIAIAIAAALVGLAWFIPAGRTAISERVIPAVKKSATGIVEVSRRPLRLLELFGGSLVVTLAYITAMILSVRAFGGTTAPAAIALVFLTGSIIATAAPTPGGLGAAEAAFIAGLKAAGEDAAVAVPAVFLYRLVTFWLPILPGWLAFHRLQRTGAI